MARKNESGAFFALLLCVFAVAFVVGVGVESCRGHNELRQHVCYLRSHKKIGDEEAKRLCNRGASWALEKYR